MEDVRPARILRRDRKQPLKVAKPQVRGSEHRLESAESLCWRLAGHIDVSAQDEPDVGFGGTRHLNHATIL